MNEDEINLIKARAVMDFVNTQVGAFESGFVDGNEVSLYSMYRFAQHHVKDNYGVLTPLMSEKWGEDIAGDCRAASENKDNKILIEVDCDAIPSGYVLTAYRKGVEDESVLNPDKTVGRLLSDTDCDVMILKKV